MDTLTVGNSNRGITFKSSGAEGMMTTGLSETVIRGAKPEMIPFEISNNLHYILFEISNNNIIIKYNKC